MAKAKKSTKINHSFSDKALNTTLMVIFSIFLAIIMYPVIIDIVRHRKVELQNEDYFEIIEHEEPQMPPHHGEFTEEELPPVEHHFFHHHEQENHNEPK